MTPTPKLRVEHVSKRYDQRGDGDPVIALSDVTISVGEGEFVSIVGPSGCGKSTLFNIVAGLEDASSGMIELSGQPSDQRLGAVGLMPQRDLLMPWKSVLDNAAVGLRIAGESKRKSREVVRGYLDEFGSLDSKSAGRLSCQGGCGNARLCCAPSWEVRICSCSTSRSEPSTP